MHFVSMVIDLHTIEISLLEKKGQGQMQITGGWLIGNWI